MLVAMWLMCDLSSHTQFVFAAPLLVLPGLSPRAILWQCKLTPRGRLNL